jgi:hypothetical protein
MLSRVVPCLLIFLLTTTWVDDDWNVEDLLASSPTSSDDDELYLPIQAQRRPNCQSETAEPSFAALKSGSNHVPLAPQSNLGSELRLVDPATPALLYVFMSLQC